MLVTETHLIQRSVLLWAEDIVVVLLVRAPDLEVLRIMMGMTAPQHDVCTTPLTPLVAADALRRRQHAGQRHFQPRTKVAVVSEAKKKRDDFF